MKKTSVIQKGRTKVVKGIRPKLTTKNAGGWYCPFVSSDNPNYVAKTAVELVMHMAERHQAAFAKAVAFAKVVSKGRAVFDGLDEAVTAGYSQAQRGTKRAAKKKSK